MVGYNPSCDNLCARMVDLQICMAAKTKTLNMDHKIPSFKPMWEGSPLFSLSTSDKVGQTHVMTKK